MKGLTMITDELRRYASDVAGLLGSSVTDVRSALEEIADRIDGQVGREYIELPKDADGEYIHIGDELEFCNGGKVRRGKVQAISDCWVFFGEGPFYGVKSCRHTKPDTWERIIEDVRRRTSDYYCNQIPCDFRKMADEMVERCKRLAGEDA